jgi:polar amino acid transport system permease protein
VDWSFIGAHVPDYLEGAWVTLRFGLYGVLCSLAVGVLCCLVRYFRIPVLRQVAA